MQTPAFDFGEAIGHFFKTLGRRPGAVFWVAFCNAILFSVFTGLILWLIAPGYLNMLDVAMAGGDPTPEDVWELVGPFFAVVPLSFIGGILVALMAQGAWLRLLVRDEVAPGIPFRLGGDEFRLLAVNIVFIVIAIALYILALGTGIGLAVAVGVSEGGAGAGALAGLGGGLLVIGAIVLAVFLAVRLSAAPALTVLDRRVRVFDAMPATRGIFWWLVLTYIVMAIIIFAAQSVLGTMIQFLFLGAFMPMMFEFVTIAETANPDPAAFTDLLREQLSEPGTMVMLGAGLFLSLFLQTLAEGAWHSVGAYTARRHRTSAGDVSPPVDAADTPPPATATEPE